MGSNEVSIDEVCEPFFNPHVESIMERLDAYIIVNENIVKNLNDNAINNSKTVKKLGKISKIIQQQILKVSIAFLKATEGDE